METTIKKDIRPELPDDNDWSTENIATVDTWIDVSSQLSFIYDTASDEARELLERLTVYGLIISSIISVFSFLNLNIDPDSAWAFVFKIVIVTFSTVATGIQSYQSIKKLQDKINIYSKYAEKASKFEGLNSNQIAIESTDLRINGIKFITENRDKYQALLMEKPDIYQKDYDRIMQKYLE